VIDDLYPTSYNGDLDVTVIEADGTRSRFSVPTRRCRVDAARQHAL
jgi:outer membrane usher protein FimD/PapC